MGRIKDFFSKFGKKNSTKNVNSNNLQNMYDIVLQYKSGTQANIKFSDELTRVELPDGSFKMLQGAKITYIEPNSEFSSKDVLLEPISYTGSDGNLVDTKQYYNQLMNSNMPLIKGFFQKEQISNIPTNYIGYIGQDANGKYNRSYDNSFNKMYKTIIEQEQYRKDLESLEYQKQFDEELRSKVQDISVHYKTSHSEYLGKYVDSKEVSDDSYQR